MVCIQRNQRRVIELCDLSDLYRGQTAEWDDSGFGGRMSGTVEHVSVSTGWVTLKLNGSYLQPGSAASSGISAEHATHRTLRAAGLTTSTEHPTIYARRADIQRRPSPGPIRPSV